MMASSPCIKCLEGWLEKKHECVGCQTFADGKKLKKIGGKEMKLGYFLLFVLILCYLSFHIGLAVGK
jgi:hypothetical protein